MTQIFHLFPEPMSVSGRQSCDKEGHTESFRDSRKGDKDSSRADGTTSHEPCSHARLYGQSRLRLRRHGGKWA